MQDHPRVCGEKSCCWDNPLAVLGSPPRMRGKEFVVDRGISHERITPAYAGKSQRLERISPVSEGSPPRMRGKVFP